MTIPRVCVPAGVGLLFGLPLTAVFWGGLVVPFVAGGVVARFWPLVRDRVLRTWNWINNTKDQFWHKEEQKGMAPCMYLHSSHGCACDKESMYQMYTITTYSVCSSTSAVGLGVSGVALLPERMMHSAL